MGTGPASTDAQICPACAYTLVFTVSTNDEHFQSSYIAGSTSLERSRVEDNFILLMIPIICVLYYKTYAGLRWVFKNFRRPALQTYYRWSWAFYTSYCI